MEQTLEKQAVKWLVKPETQKIPLPMVKMSTIITGADFKQVLVFLVICFSLTGLFQELQIAGLTVTSCKQASKHPIDTAVINTKQAELINVPLLLGLCKQVQSEGNTRIC